MILDVWILVRVCLLARSHVEMYPSRVFPFAVQEGCNNISGGRQCVYVCMYYVYMCDVYIHVCMYVFMYVCMYIPMYVCIYVFMYVCMYVSMYVFVCACGVCVCIYARMYVCMYLCICVCMHDARKHTHVVLMYKNTLFVSKDCECNHSVPVYAIKSGPQALNKFRNV